MEPTRRFVRRTGNIGGLRERSQRINESRILYLLADLQISYCQFLTQVCDLHVFCIRFHQAKLIKNLLRVCGRVACDSARILCVFVAYRVNVAIRFTAILLSYRLFILYILRFPRKFRLYLHPIQGSGTRVRFIGFHPHLLVVEPSVILLLDSHSLVADRHIYIYVLCMVCFVLCF